MGSFFTNVQVRRSRYSSLENIERALDELAKQAGMIRGTTGALAYDRTIIVHAGAGDWISVYDEATEDQSPDNLDMLAAKLSAATESTAVSILVHDSDILLLGLFVNGQKLDEFNNNPDYFDGAFEDEDGVESGVSDEDGLRVAGQAERWEHLLVAGATPKMLVQAWQQKETFAEEQLAHVAELFGWPLNRVRVGLNDLDLDEDEIPSSELRICTYVISGRGEEGVNRLQNFKTLL
jgi:hypothetical protein